MNFVIPMAGRGQRFKNAGYALPKMLIEAHGKTLLEWSIDSLPLELCTNMICVVLDEHEREHRLSQKIEAVYGARFPIHFHFLKEITRGQAETVFLTHPLIDFTKALLVFNIDTQFHSDSLPAKLKAGSKDGVLGAFKSIDKRFSFAALDEVSGLVTRTTEKEPISVHALTGLYHFSNPADFFEATNYYLQNDIRVNNEFYIAPMYNYLIERGRKFVIDEVTEHHILGTPEELAIFLAKGISK